MRRKRQISDTKRGFKAELTNQPTPQEGAPPEKLVKKFSAVCGTRNVLAVFM
jgi:hypothetical protein